MLEVYVLVEKKRSVLLNVLEIFLWVLTVLFGVLALLGASILIWLALLLGVTAYFIHTRRYEYEYSCFDGDVRFAKIINKSRRKKLPGYKMAEVMAIAPKGHDRVSQYEKDNTAAVRNLCSGFKDARIYVMAAKDKDGIELVYFEPDETYLNEICKRYPSRVTK